MMNEIPDDIKIAEREAQEAWDTWRKVLLKPDTERSRAEAALVYYKNQLDYNRTEPALARAETPVQSEKPNEETFTSKQVAYLIAELFSVVSSK